MSLLTAKIDKKLGTLTIVLNLEKEPEFSTSGKSLIIATSSGSTPTNIFVDDKNVQISAVAFTKK